MVTYLCALRFAVNVEHTLEQLQRQRFALTGDTGCRALPPLIPLHRHEKAPDPAWLDDIRRKHVVKLNPSSPVPADIPPARIDLSSQDPSNITGHNPTVEQIITLQRALSERSNATPPPTDFVPADLVPAYPPEIVLSWQDEDNHPAPVALPETSALWLSVFRIESANAPWWEYLRWTQVYSRRLKAQQH